MITVLDCRDLTVSFGNFVAVDGFSFAFEKGRIYGIIGPNGAGKTTLMNTIVGSVALRSGSVALNGKDVTHLGVPARARLGLGRSFQVTKVFAGMTTRENLRIAAQRKQFGIPPFLTPVGRFPALAAKADETLHTIGLERYADVDADMLSHGDVRALELGLTIIGDPSLLLLDEPLAGVGHHDTDKAITLLRGIMADRTVLLIEHNMDAVMNLAEEVLVMVNGRLMASGTPQEIRANRDVRAAYLGGE
jgi:branched-chain amino acid transport system ATP-binding protein